MGQQVHSFWVSPFFILQLPFSLLFEVELADSVLELALIISELVFPDFERLLEVVLAIEATVATATIHLVYYLVFTCILPKIFEESVPVPDLVDLDSNHRLKCCSH